jgi:hypothetical protein
MLVALTASLVLCLGEDPAAPRYGYSHLAPWVLQLLVSD